HQLGEIGAQLVAERLLLARERDLHQAGARRTGIALIPFRKPERSLRGGPASSMPGARCSSSSNMIRISKRARLAPRQKWGPPAPNVMCSLGDRATSKTSGLSNTSS